MKNSLVIYFILIFNLSYSQDCFKMTEQVFDKIILSIGNFSIKEPRLKIENIKRPAIYYNGNITISKKLITILCESGNFEDKISFVLAHELAHHYLQHNWKHNSGFSYVENSLSDEQDRLEAETQADIYAGHYGKVSGYETLRFAKETINEIYTGFEINKELVGMGYPSFEERLNIINESIEQANNLAEVFELGNILLKLGEYDIAAYFFESIESKFNSREILNNLAIAHLLEGIKTNKNEKITELIFPLIIDLDTRVKVKKTRSLSSDPETNFKQAKKYFNKALFLDNNYLPAMQNLFSVNYLLCSEQNQRDLEIEKILESNLSEQTKIDFQVINEILKETKEKKIKKLSLKGSEVSRINTDSNESINSDNLNGKSILKKLNLYKDFIELTTGWSAFDADIEKITIEGGYLNIDKYSLDDNFFFKIVGRDKYLIQIKNDLFSIDENLSKGILNENKYSYFILNSIY